MEKNKNKSRDKAFIGTIDCTPTWEGVLPILLDGLKSDSVEVYHNSMKEFRRMAQHADKYNSSLQDDANKLKTLKKQFSEVDNFMLLELKCGANLEKLEQWEENWDIWKKENGFNRSYDCATVSATIKMRMESLENGPIRTQS